MSFQIDLNNLPDNPEDLHKVFEELDSGDTGPLVDDPKPGDTANTDGTVNEGEGKGAQDDQKPAAQQDQQQIEANQANDESDAAGVATKDGKHVIPYSVLKSERERANRAEQLVRETQERIAALEAAAKSGSQGAKDGEGARTEAAQPAAGELSSEDLEALKEDFPTVHKALVALQAKASAIEAGLKPVVESQRDAEQTAARTAYEQVQDAIDSVPKLAHIQAHDAAAFTMAKSLDATLRTDPAWADKPLSERFAKVVELLEVTRGPIQLPGAKPTAPSAEELAQAAKAKADAQARANRSAVPTSLSEFPAGAPAANSEREAVEQMSVHQLHAKFAGMTPEQMDAYLQTL